MSFSSRIENAIINVMDAQDIIKNISIGVILGVTFCVYIFFWAAWQDRKK